MYICAVLPEPSLLAHINREQKEASDKESQLWPHRVARHACLKALKQHNNKTPFPMRWLIYRNFKKLELVFVKHYAPNICLPLNMAKFAVP